MNVPMFYLFFLFYQTIGAQFHVNFTIQLFFVFMLLIDESYMI